tara:strand:- start:693 stop:1217 length:525 start_codon:yes stop_codon:yes gene_type:complete
MTYSSGDRISSANCKSDMNACISELNNSECFLSNLEGISGEWFSTIINDKGFLNTIVAHYRNKNNHVNFVDKYEVTKVKPCIGKNLNEMGILLEKSIENNNNKIEKLMKKIKDSSKNYIDIEKELSNLRDLNDASKPRRMDNKKMMQSDFLKAFVYISVILGGSYYIYHFFKSK